MFEAFRSRLDNHNPGQRLSGEAALTMVKKAINDNRDDDAERLLSLVLTVFDKEVFSVAPALDINKPAS